MIDDIINTPTKWIIWIFFLLGISIFTGIISRLITAKINYAISKRMI